jgi:hypothetical protein
MISMKSGKKVWVYCKSGLISILDCLASVSAGPMSLPFFEAFDTISDLSQIGVNYPEFTAEQAVGGARKCGM